MANLRIGVDLGGTKIEAVVLDEEGRIVRRERIETEQEGGYEHIVGRLAMLVKRMREAAPAATAIGIGTPGSLSSVTGAIKNSNTVCINGRRLNADIAEAIGLDVIIENDANCFTLAEALAGAGKGGDVVFGVIMGTGVGGGIILHGKVHAGHQHLGGEWGHHCIDPNGPLCFCGNRGCVETHISGPAVIRHYEQAGGQVPPGPRALKEVIERARAGEPRAAATVDWFLDRFGRSLANVIDILDPDVIVLGGGLSNIEELYTRGRERVEHYVCNDELRTPIVRNELGDSAGVIGAALLVADD